MDIDSLFTTMSPADTQRLLDRALLTAEIVTFAIVILMWWWIWRNTPR